jgi:hypothetical protein
MKRLLTQRQLQRMEKLPADHKMVSARDGSPVVRRPDGRLLRIQPNGRLAAMTLIERVQS